MILELRRSTTPELLDGPISDVGALADNLRDLRRLDGLLGNTALIWRYLEPMLRLCQGDTPFTLLDVATGGADGPCRLRRLAQQRGYDLQPIASDRSIDVLRLARASGLPLVRHDVLAIPVADGGVDVVTCTLALHHFEPHAAMALLRELRRVARLGAIVMDLRRSWPTYIGARLLALGPWHAMSRHDGPISALRAYTLEEARDLVAQAGIRDARVERVGVVRLAIVMSFEPSTTLRPWF